jgi:predicted Rossmann fold nucleotide-binding protein DprA/Smf involved in DNA uptake
MDVVYLAQDDPRYPVVLQACLGDQAPKRLATLGNLEVLHGKKLALFGSVKCPTSLILRAHDFAYALREGGVTVMSGFHSPVEREALTVLLRGTASVVVGMARGLEGMRMKKEYQKPLDEGRLLLLSPFEAKHKRATVRSALYRNRMVAALADAVVVVHASSGGRTERFFREVLAWGKPLASLGDLQDATGFLRSIPTTNRWWS